MTAWLRKFRKITPEETAQITERFLSELDTSTVRRNGHKCIIVIGGAPGSGKTTAADLMTYLAGAVHVQSNSARYLLSMHSLPWGENVNLVIQAVLNEVLRRGQCVVLDGMVTEEDERNLIRQIGQKYNARVFFNAMLCDPQLTKSRARQRYTDGHPGSFKDWRASSNKFEGYIKSIEERTKLLQEEMARANQSPNSRDHIWSISNNGTREDLVAILHPIWTNIQSQLDSQGQ